MTFAPSTAQSPINDNFDIAGENSLKTILHLDTAPNPEPPISDSGKQIIAIADNYKTDILTPNLFWSRVTDILLSASALLILLPALMLICLVIWLTDRGPPIFAHRRVGKAGKHFPCLKFRTMVTDADKRLAELLRTDSDAAKEWKEHQKLRKDPRITPVGHMLRKTSLDEIPQLFNVLIGQMSLVGPRPIVDNEIAHYGRYFQHYCSVRPGITGLWQVSGRSDVSYRRRVVMDTVYCRSKSLALDLSILTRTVPAVLMQRGAA
jgi:exopolysaccharide production protein ExoY